MSDLTDAHGLSVHFILMTSKSQTLAELSPQFQSGL